MSNPSDQAGSYQSAEEYNAIAKQRTTQPTPTTTGVSEAMVERAYDAYVSKLEAMLTSGQRIDKNEFRHCRSAMRVALEAALSTAPAGDGVPGMVEARRPLTSHARTSPGPINCNLRLRDRATSAEAQLERARKALEQIADYPSHQAGACPDIAARALASKDEGEAR